MQLVTQFLDENAARLRSNKTRINYRHHIEHCLADLGKPLNKITVEDLRAWCHSGHLAPGTINRRVSILRRFFGWAHRRGLLSADPTTSLGEVASVRPKVVRKRTWLSEPQIRTVIDQAGPGLLGQRDRVLLTVGFHTALRIHEICNLRWHDIDLEGRVLHTVGKGEKPATIGLSATVAGELEEWRQVQLAHGASSAVVLPRFRRLFDEVRPVWSEPLGVTGAYEVVKRCGRQAGFPHLAPHDMRRSLIGILDKRGVPLTEIKGVSRHSNLATLERYLEDNPARSIDRMQSFEL